MNKVQVLTNVIRSAALTVLERVGWLADDAGAAARSIEHPAVRQVRWPVLRVELPGCKAFDQMAGELKA